MAPFGASCFLAFATPTSPLAQPRSIVFGHFISSAVGLAILQLFGPDLLPMAAAMGLAITLMLITRTSHSPAATDPLVIFVHTPGWDFLLFPVLSGALVVTTIALIFNNLRGDTRYPTYW